MKYFVEKHKELSPLDFDNLMDEYMEALTPITHTSQRLRPGLRLRVSHSHDHMHV